MRGESPEASVNPCAVPLSWKIKVFESVRATDNRPLPYPPLAESASSQARIKSYGHGSICDCPLTAQPHFPSKSLWALYLVKLGCFFAAPSPVTAKAAEAS